MRSHINYLQAVGCAFLLSTAVTRFVCAAEPAVAPASVGELRARLEAHVAQTRFSGALWGVKVASLETGQVLFEHHADRLLSPASNSKLYTAALALDRLGGDYRIVTPLFATAKPDSNGKLAGDLIISGRGDPSWKAKPRRGDFAAIFEPFVAALRKAGVRHITGDVIADATFFRGPGNGAGWTVDDLNDDYGAEISAITLDDNYVDVRVTPGPKVGEPGSLRLVQPATRLTLHNRTVTVAEGRARHLEVRRLLGGNTAYVLGEVPLGAADVFVDVTVPCPASWFAEALKGALIQAGITVGGEARAVAWPQSSAVKTDAVRLGEIVSPPLRELVAAFMKPSQNLETDLIFGHVGELTRTAETPSWRTSEQLGVAALRNFLRSAKLPADDVHFEEGSGLSRNNLTTPNATLGLLHFMAQHAEARAWTDALPIAGVDGTLRTRFKNTAAEGNVRAKTGTLRWAIGLSGYVTSAAGERLAFSIMLNRAVAPASGSSRGDVDVIPIWLAQLSARSTAVAAEGSGRE
jgi:serine-type D-Ala-D-Ala carboxypeptidase/endopeptidase (penicillin-binding protein 4)